jgi:hypothetical protein
MLLTESPAEPGAAPDRGISGLAVRTSPEPPRQVSLVVSAPSEAWRFQQGESPCQGRANHPPVPSVAVMEEVGMN